MVLRVPKLNKGQLDRVSEIYMGIGHITLASVVIPTLIDKLDFRLLILGLVTSTMFWLASIIALKSIR